MDTHCVVCVNPFNNSHRKRIVCTHCGLECCTQCVTTYLENSVLTPQCMQCHNVWTHQYVRENFGGSFVKKMEKVRKSVLFNEQQALFPHTQEYVSLLNRFETLNNRHDERYYSNAWWRERNNVGLRINYIRYPLNNYPTNSTTTPTQTQTQTKVYIKPCGKGECKGYVNASTNTCELCDTSYCAKCMEEKCADHTCKPENVATVSMLRKDTKGCPKCAVPFIESVGVRTCFV